MVELEKLVGDDPKAKAQLDKVAGVIVSGLKQTKEFQRGGAVAGSLAGSLGLSAISKNVGPHELPFEVKKRGKRCIRRNSDQCATDGDCFLELTSSLCLRNCTAIVSEETCTGHASCRFEREGPLPGCKNDCFVQDLASGALSPFTCGHCQTEKACKLMGKFAPKQSKGRDGKTRNQHCVWAKEADLFPNGRCVNDAHIGVTDAERRSIDLIRERGRDMGNSTAEACMNPDVENGRLEPNKAAFKPGDTATVVCDEGFEPSDIAAKIECEKGSGKFSPVVTCIAGGAGRKQGRIIDAVEDSAAAKASGPPSK